MDNIEFLTRCAAETTKLKAGKRGKPTMPVEQEGMPQHQHCPPAKRREYIGTKMFYEEQQTDVPALDSI
jgi:hypothetical protein